MDKEKSPPHEPPPQPLQPHPPPQEQSLQQQHQDQLNQQQLKQPLPAIVKLSKTSQLVLKQQKPSSSITPTSQPETASSVTNYEFLDLTDVDDSERKYLTTTLFTSSLSTNVKTTSLSASYLAIKKTKNLKKIQNFNNSYYYQQQPLTQQQIPPNNIRSINKHVNLPLINSLQQQQCNNNWIFLNAITTTTTTTSQAAAPIITTAPNVASNISASTANIDTFIKLQSDNEIVPSFDDQSTANATNIIPAATVISTLNYNNNFNKIDTNLNNSFISIPTSPANSFNLTSVGDCENLLSNNIYPTATAVLNSSTSTSWHEQPYGCNTVVTAPTIYQQQFSLHHLNDQQSAQQQRPVERHRQMQLHSLPQLHINLIRNLLVPRFLLPLANSLPFFTIFKPIRTLTPFREGTTNSTVIAPVETSITTIRGTVNGNFDSTTPSEEGTESSSITTDQQNNQIINNICNSIEIGQIEKEPLLTALSDTIQIIDGSIKEDVVNNMSPHVTNQQILHQQQHHHQNNMPATPTQQGNGGNNGGGNGQHMYNHQIAPSGYITPTSHGTGGPTMYQMLPPNLPGNVYVSNVPGNANIHNYMAAQGIPQYAFGPHTYISPDEQQQQQQSLQQHHQHHQHLQHHHHHHHHQQQQQNIPPNARGGSRRGRGRGNGGNRREYIPRQHQTQEIMSPIIESQPVMGPSGYTQYYVGPFPPYYPGGPSAPMGHPNAQHATGSPLYLNHMSMYAAGAPIYGYPQNMVYPTAMLPPEFAMVEDKNEEHGSESGSMTPVPNMWHPHISLDYSSLEHGGVHIIDPQQQSHMEDYLSQENLDEAQGLLQPVSSPSPMHHHSMPQHSQHILNPNVATFKQQHITSGEIMYHHPHIHHQHHQQQSMTQQMADYGINSLSPIDALSPVPNQQQLSGSGSMISLTPTPTPPPPQHIIHGSPGMGGNNQSPYLVTAIQQEQHVEPVVLINHNNEILQHSQIFLNNQQRTTAQPMTIIDNNMVMFKNQHQIEQSDPVANEQINNYNNLVNNNINDDITVLHEVPSETLVMDTNNNNDNVTVTTNINSNNLNNNNSNINNSNNNNSNNNNDNVNVNNSMNIKVVPNSVFINNINNNNYNIDTNNQKINDDINKLVKSTHEKLIIKADRGLSKPPGWSAKKQTQSVAVTAIPSAVAAATAAASSGVSSMPMPSNKQQETKLIQQNQQQQLVSSLIPQPPMGGIQSRQRISPPPFATSNNKVNYTAPQTQNIKLSEVLNTHDKPLVADIISVEQSNGEIQPITGMVSVVQCVPLQQQVLSTNEILVKTVESKQVEAIPQRTGVRNNGIISDNPATFALDNKSVTIFVGGNNNINTINKDSPTMATVTATATPDDILKDTTAAAVKSTSAQAIVVQQNNIVVPPVIVSETVIDHIPTSAPSATVGTWAGLFTAKKGRLQQGQAVVQLQTVNTTPNVSQSPSANLPLSAVIGTSNETRKPIAKISPFANNVLVTVNPPNASLSNNNIVPNTVSSPTAANLITPGISYSAASSKGLKNAPANVVSNQLLNNSGVTIKQANTKLTIQQKPTNDEFSYKMGDYLHKYHIDNNSVSLLPRGLTNRSNYCYINSILQALVNCPPFYNLIRSITTSQYRFGTKLQNSNTTATPIIDAMVELVKEFSLLPVGARLNRREKGQKKDDSSFDISSEIPFEPNVVYKMLNGIRSDMFQIEGRQEDAEEFLGCILNGLNDEMLELIKLVNKPPPIIHNGDTNSDSNNDDGDDWQIIYGNRNKGAITRKTDYGRTPISDIFRGQLRSRLQRDGEPTTDVVQPFFTLQLDIEKAQSVKEALEILVGRDQLEGVTCSKTNQEVAAWQQVSLEELPVVLILHLKWFDYKLDGCTKILKAVEFPIELKIDSKLMSAKIKYSQKQKQYKLFAIVYHDGKEASKGHYITDVYNVGYGSWMRYDDSIVKPINEQNVLHPRVPRVPYLLYYRRCDTIGPQNQQQNNNK